MALITRRRGAATAGLEAWPGYVDALSTLLLVIIFVLLVFVLAQFFLSAALTGRNKALDKVTQQLADVSHMLSLEKGHAAGLEQSVAQLTAQLAASQADRTSLSTQLAQLQDRIKQTLAEHEALQTKLTGATQLAETNASRAEQLQSQVGDLKQQLAELQKQAAALDKTVAANKETIQAKLSDLAKLEQETRALQALRDQLEAQAESAAARAMTEQQRREAVEAQLAKEKDLGNSAAAQIALLNRQVDNLKSQLTAVAQALDLAQASEREKNVQIANLGQQLNAALAAKVQELQAYRSEFFGELRQILTNKPGIRVVGDRFVIESDVLFPVGRAELSPDGEVQILKLADTIKQIAGQIPPKINWVLDVDGYADKQPINGGQFPSNWELSAARAISVVNLLVKQGVPPEHVSATAFGDNHPLDAGDSQEAFARNRRIELRLTDYGSGKQS
jgi:chemotaxis protein MotB